MHTAIWVIARAQLQIARNRFWRGKIGRKIGLVAIGALLALGSFGIYWAMRGITSFITSQRFERLLAEATRASPDAGLPTDLRPYLDALPSAVLFAALAVLIVTGFTTVLSSLYLSGDIELLLSAPVPMRAVFVVKFFGGLLTPYVLLFFLLGPALVGYGQGLGYGAPFFLTTLVVLALFPLLPVGLGALLVMAVVRVIPPQRAREIVGVIGGLFGAGWYLLSQYSGGAAARVRPVETLGSLRALDIPLLPSAWAGRALAAAGRGEWLTLLVYGGLFAGLSIGIFALCVVLAERLYYSGWSNMAAQGGRIRRPAADDRRTATAPGGRWSAVSGRIAGLLPPESAAILLKDLRVFPRDLRNLQQIIFPLALSGFWVFQLLSGDAPSGRRGADLRETLGALAPAGLAFFICLSLSNALGGPSISREGRGYWMLKAAPVSARRVLLGKLALAYLPFPVIGTLFILVISLLQGSDVPAVVRSLALLLLVGLGTSSLSLGFGAAFPRFDWESPQQQRTLRAGLLTTVSYLLYMALALSAALGLPALGALLDPPLGAAVALLGWVLLAGATAAVAWGALAFGAARLERVEVT